MTHPFARGVLRAHRAALHARANVVATGIGYKSVGGKRTKDLALVCSVERKLPLAALSVVDRIPAHIDGLRTDVVAVGKIRALASRTERARPAPGGVSIGHRDITAGTLGCLVRKGGETFILSNNHVLANSNAGLIGDPILQPGPVDGGILGRDTIGALSHFEPIRFVGAPDPPSDCPFATFVARVLNLGCSVIGSRTRYRIVRPASVSAIYNLVDCALARPVRPQDVSAEILEIGAPVSVGEGSLGMVCVKSGRTTGLTRGEILQTDVSASVQYGSGRLAMFSDQLMAGPISQGGDSGSAVLDSDRRLIGLLFAGSDTVTIINRMANVFAVLGIDGIN